MKEQLYNEKKTASVFLYEKFNQMKMSNSLVGFLGNVSDFSNFDDWHEDDNYESDEGIVEQPFPFSKTKT